MKFKRGQTLIAAQRCQRSIRFHRGIRQARRAVPAYTVPIKGVKAEFHMLGHGDAAVRSHSAAILRRVIGSLRGSGAGQAQNRFHARIDAVAESTEDAEDFVVAESGFKGCLDDNVWHRVERIVGGRVRVIQTAASAGTAESEVRGSGAVYREGGLRILQRSGQPEAIVEVLGQADAPLPRKTETDRIVRVNGHGHRFGSVVDPLLGFCGQGPHLAAREGPAIVEGSLPPSLPLAQGVAVGLVVV